MVISTFPYLERLGQWHPALYQELRTDQRFSCWLQDFLEF